MLIVESIHQSKALINMYSNQKMPLEKLAGQKVCALSSIGDPISFEKLLRDLHAPVHKHFQFRDHHLYAQPDIESIIRYCSQNKLEAIVTTEKDAVKLEPFLRLFPKDLNIYSLNIQLTIVDNYEPFIKRIDFILPC